MRDTFEERTARVLRRMIPGGFSGRTEQINPVRAPSRQLDTYRPPPDAAAGKTYDTLVVATSNPTQPSVHAAASDADLIVTGTDDDLAIQNLLDSSGLTFGSGGQIVLLDGIYNFSSTGTGSLAQNLHGANQVSLRGMGPNATIIKSTIGSGKAVLEEFHRVEGVEIQAGAGVINVLDAWLTEDCWFTGSGLAVVPAGQGQVVSCYLDTDTGVGPNSDSRVLGCYFDSGVGVDMSGGGAGPNPFYALVANNTFSGCTNAVLFGSHGHCSVVNNVLVNCGSGGDALPVDGPYQNVQGNMIRRNGTTVTNGIHVLSTATGALVANNDLHDAATTPYLDAGTGTITLGGNRT